MPIWSLARMSAPWVSTLPWLVPWYWASVPAWSVTLPALADNRLVAAVLPSPVPFWLVRA